MCFLVYCIFFHHDTIDLRYEKFSLACFTAFSVLKVENEAFLGLTIHSHFWYGGFLLQVCPNLLVKLVSVDYIDH